jgi:hypothetical protein
VSFILNSELRQNPVEGLFLSRRIFAKSTEDKLQNKLRILSSPNLLWIKLRGGQDLPGKTEHILRLFFRHMWKGVRRQQIAESSSRDIPSAIRVQVLRIG